MSKSKGNFFTLRDLLEKNVDPLSLRFLLLSTHYRKMLNFTFEALDQAQASLQRIRDFLYELKSRTFQDREKSEIPKLIEETRQKFIMGLSSDLNISVALTALFELIRKANTLISQEKIGKKDAKSLISFIHSLDQVLACLAQEKEKTLDAFLLKKIEERERARQEKNYQLADKIRQELLLQGIVLEDTKEGVRWKIIKRNKEKI
jgi:cysteinyl-tRNA synthetase